MSSEFTERLLVLLRTHFFNRTDRAGIQNEKGKITPVHLKEGELDPLLRTHLVGDKAPKAVVTTVYEKSLSVFNGRFRVGSYTPNEDNATRWFCIDVDGPGHKNCVADAPTAASKILDQCAKYELPAHLERSKSGTGWHIWVFFEEQIPAEDARKVALALIPGDIPLARGGFANPKKNEGIEVFPKQEKLSAKKGKGVGNMLWLPWWNSADKGCCQFYKRESLEFVPYVPDSFETVTLPQLAAALDRAKMETAVEEGDAVPVALTAENFPDELKAWRKEVLDALDLEQVYGAWLTGKNSGNGWLECRDPQSPSGDRTPSAGVADGTGEAERGRFHSFISNESMSVFDFMVAQGFALDFEDAARRLGDLTGKPYNPRRRCKKRESTSTLQQGDKALPVIIVNARQLKDIVADGWRSVFRANQKPDIFRRYQHLVQLVQCGDGLTIEPMSEDNVYNYISNAAIWMIKHSKNEEEDAWPPREVAKSMRAKPHDELPELESVQTSPVFSSSGEAIHEPGYHSSEKLWYAPPQGLTIPEVPREPTVDEIASARSLLLDDLTCDFPFVSESDRAHWLAALILPFVRRMIAGPTPLHFVEAPCNGAGKSLLCDVISIIVTGRACNSKTLPVQEEEAAKTFTAELLKAQPIILLDNQNERTKLNSPALASVLTTEHWSGRLLGQSKMLTLPNRALWMMTGNNPNVSTEISRRCLRIRIDPRRDRAWQRDPGEFKHPKLKSWTLANRGNLIHAVHTLVNAWIAAGKPEGSGSMGSFEEWVAVMGGILHVANVPGFLECLDEMYRQADSDGEEWRAFVSAWWDEYADTPQAVSTLNAVCENSSLMIALRGDGSIRSQESRLGRALNTARDRVFGSHRILAVDDVKYSKGRRFYSVIPMNNDGPGGFRGGAGGQCDLRFQDNDPTRSTSAGSPECRHGADMVQTLGDRSLHFTSADVSTVSEDTKPGADMCRLVPAPHACAHAHACAHIEIKGVDLRLPLKSIIN